MYYEDENNLYHYSYRKGDTNVVEPVYNTRNYAEETAAPAEEPPKKKGRWAKLVALMLACSLAGVPYMWGGNTVKHFDCSGLVKFCYFMNGILLPRNASQQVKCGTPVAGGEYKPGDLLFFGSRKPLRITHVAIYIGDGRIVHSSHSVRIMSLGDYARDVVAATRILTDIDKGKGAGTVLGSPYYFEQNGE